MTFPSVAVTGATGFIGPYVVEELARRGIACVAVSRTPSDLVESGTGRHIAMDLREPPANAFDLLGRPEVLIDLAWGGLPNYASPHHSEKEGPAHYRFVRQMVAAGTRRVLVAGTCLEYGVRPGELDEALEPRPSIPYAQAKDVLRRELESLSVSTPFSLVWTRIFYLWGEGQARSSLFAQLRDAAARGDREFPMSMGTQLRDYLHVAEAARLIVALAVGETPSCTVNVCSGRPVSVMEMVQGWIRDHDWDIKPAPGRYPVPAYEADRFWGSRAALDAALGTSAYKE